MLFYTSYPCGICVSWTKISNSPGTFFWNLLQTGINSFKTTSPIVTNEERGNIDAVAKYLESSRNLRYWNRLIHDVRRWLQDRKRGAPSLGVASYLADTYENSFSPTYRKSIQWQTSKDVKKMECCVSWILHYWNSPPISHLSGGQLSHLMCIIHSCSGVINN